MTGNMLQVCMYIQPSTSSLFPATEFSYPPTDLKLYLPSARENVSQQVQQTYYALTSIAMVATTGS